MPQKLEFNDGSRVFTDPDSSSSDVAKASTSSSTPDNDQAFLSRDASIFTLEDYYQLSTISNQIIAGWKKGASLRASPPSAKASSTPNLLRVALQFPPYLLSDSSEVCWQMEELIRSKLTNEEDEVLTFILGDTAYGSCCVDEVAAEHLDAHVVVHYGRSCLSKTNRVPALYVFGKLFFDVSVCNDAVTEQIKKFDTKDVVVLYDVLYQYKINEVKSMLKASNPDCNFVVGQLEDEEDLMLGISNINSGCFGGDDENDENENDGGSCCGGGGGGGKKFDPTSSSSSSSQSACCGDSSNNSSPLPLQLQLPPTPPPLNPNQLTIGGLQVTLPSTSPILTSYTLLYVGVPSRQLINVLMRCSGTDGTAHQWSYNPHTSILNVQAEDLCRNEVKRRYFLTQKAKSANVIGIVVGTLGVVRFKDVITKLRHQITSSGRTSYLFVVGKVNVAKLANFAEIDAFVIVACPENSILESRMFHVPVVTPLEMEVALDYREWGWYSVEFGDYLKQTEGGEKEGNDDDDDDPDNLNNSNDAPYFSLITGQYIPRKTKDDHTLNLSALPGKGQLTQYKSVAGEFLNQREYTGLKTAIGESDVVGAVKGQFGIASAYDNDERSLKK